MLHCFFYSLHGNLNSQGKYIPVPINDFEDCHGIMNRFINEENDNSAVKENLEDNRRKRQMKNKCRKQMKSSSCNIYKLKNKMIVDMDNILEIVLTKMCLC